MKGKQWEGDGSHCVSDSGMQGHHEVTVALH